MLEFLFNKVIKMILKRNFIFQLSEYVGFLFWHILRSELLEAFVKTRLSPICRVFQFDPVGLFSN